MNIALTANNDVSLASEGAAIGMVMGLVLGVIASAIALASYGGNDLIVIVLGGGLGYAIGAAFTWWAAGRSGR